MKNKKFIEKIIYTSNELKIILLNEKNLFYEENKIKIENFKIEENKIKEENEKKKIDEEKIKQN
eukprot:EC819872.1.p1 GENE.EC819872.1~~EC819872.1.p1  ORF type:complete len:64 (+),score=36.20 EC819872.1:88-279(+)